MTAEAPGLGSPAAARPVSEAQAPPVVVKIGGRPLELPGMAAELGTDLAALGGPAVVVHGGGAMVTDWSARLGIPARFSDGLRVTDPATLEVTVAVLRGLINARLVAALRAAGVDAVGLSALDGIAEVAPHPRAAVLGAVGAVVQIHRESLAAWTHGGRTPVLASIGAHGGRLFNLNADDLAADLAAALGARALVLLSDVPGVLLDGEALVALEAAAIPRLLAGSAVRDGMRPKLQAVQRALAAGVTRAHIAAWRGPGTLAAIVNGAGAGTTLWAESQTEAARA